MPGVRDVTGQESGFVMRVADPDTQVPRIVEALVGLGAAIQRVVPRTRSLESVYLECLRREAP